MITQRTIASHYRYGNTSSRFWLALNSCDKLRGAHKDLSTNLLAEMTISVVAFFGEFFENEFSTSSQMQQENHQVSEQNSPSVEIIDAAKVIFNYSCAQISEARKNGCGEERKKFFELARALEGAFRRISFLDSPALPNNENGSEQPMDNVADGNVH